MKGNTVCGRSVLIVTRLYTKSCLTPAMGLPVPSKKRVSISRSQLRLEGDSIVAA